MTWVVILLVLGTVLLAVETVVPGGILGFVGSCLILGGVITAYIELPLPQANWVLAAISAVLVLGAILWVVWFPTSPLARHLSANQIVGNLGHDYEHMLDQRGLARSALRPSGFADFDEQRLDVITEGGFVDAGTAVLVVSVEGSKIVVRAIE